jgi:myo-inositol-1(or 4)-monophosphatase
MFDGFWEGSLHAWDVAAGAVIVEEAGGVVSDFRGKKLDLFKGEFLCSNGRIHNEMLRLLRK